MAQYNFKSFLNPFKSVNLLVTLVAGLENVSFKLYNDVPYLDNSCWPTHMTIKRQIVDVLLNSSVDSFVNQFKASYSYTLVFNVLFLSHN